MGVWEEQEKRAIQNRQQWLEAQNFNFIRVLLSATNEEEVKAAYVREFSLPVKTQERHDLVVDRILFEFKYSVKLKEIKVAAKVIAQAIYYINRLFKKGRIDEVDYLVVADKDEARIFRVTEFQLFYESYEYDWAGFTPSSPDPKLIEAIRNSRLLESNRVYRVTSQDEFQLFSSRLYKILTPRNSQHKITDQKKYVTWNLKKVIIIWGVLILILSSGIVLGSQYYFNFLNKSTPVHNKQ